MFFLAVHTLLYVGALAGDIGQPQLPLTSGKGPRAVPGGSIVKLCPESRDTDLLQIKRIVNRPQVFYLDDEQDVFIQGNFTRDIPVDSTVHYQINATANTGDFGALDGTFHICDYLEEMRQPVDSKVKWTCPPVEGSVLIDYATWFADWLVAPGQWSVKFDAKTPEGERIYCLQTEFDLQCPPWHEGPECLRSAPDDVKSQMNKWTRLGRGIMPPWPATT